MVSRYNKNRNLDVIENFDMDEPFEEEPSSMHLRPTLASCEDRDVSSLDLVLDSPLTGDVPSKAGQNKELGLSVTVLLNIFHALRRRYLSVQTVFLTTKNAVAK
ncbi:hypothetical protein A0H81_01020 [Grifola frondosa]|uniref:Uncharacterized protein n=1 Tax=Grifola frondosa TaxID=5627 RepID=A0A1C7MUA4_GRIFR|nr:hypothetical protein A0H81_01020 [Grifola frondosa]